MPQDGYIEIPELAAARVVDGLMKSRVGSDRAEICGALLAWITVLLGDCSSAERTGIAFQMLRHAAWLAPHEKFDEKTFRLVREPLDAWVARHS